jgi:diaminopimelate epimerase
MKRADSRPNPYFCHAHSSNPAMTSVPFVKYHGAGNDFIMIDDRQGAYEKMINTGWIANACHRHFGIGADGMILLQSGMDGADFFMRYYNSDGNISSFCGNGGRCIVAFASRLGMHHGSCRFLGTDGWHSGSMLSPQEVSLSMKDVDAINVIDDGRFILDTGSPHYVLFSREIDNIDVRSEGRFIRNSPSFGAKGINVNFVQPLGPGEIAVRTYERGVEDETMACGTGVVASAIAAAFISDEAISDWKIHARGGHLQVTFERRGSQSFTDVKLIGPAVAVFTGEIGLH